MCLGESYAEFIFQMPFAEIFVVIGGQIDQRKTCGMKIRKSRSSALTDLVYLQALYLRFNYALPFFCTADAFCKTILSARTTVALFLVSKCLFLLIYEFIIYYNLVKINNKLTKKSDFIGLFAVICQFILLCRKLKLNRL